MCGVCGALTARAMAATRDYAVVAASPYCFPRSDSKPPHTGVPPPHGSGAGDGLCRDYTHGEMPSD